MPADRAVSTTVGYALTLVITTLLVTGLLIAGGDFVADQRDGAARNELRVLGQQIAADIAAADRLGRISGPDGDLTLTRALPDQVTGATYTLNVSQVGTRDTYEIFLESDTVGQTGTARVYSRTPVFTRGNLTGGDVQVEYNSVTRELAVKDSGPYVFPEQSPQQIVVEAESFPRDEPGTGDFASHYWYAFEDPLASGDRALTTAPNVSSGGGTGDSKEGPRLDYEVDFASGGTYYVFVRMRAPADQPGESDSIHVAVEGTATPPTYGGQGLSEGTGTSWTWVHGVVNDGNPGDFVQVDSGSGGVKTLHIWMREDGTQIDKIVLKKSNTAPTGVGPSESDWQ